MKKILSFMALSLMLNTVNAHAFFCEEYEEHEDISPQHKYVNRIDVLSCRMEERLQQMPWLYFSETGRPAYDLANTYREAALRLLECTNFSESNTREDRVFACSNQMDLTYKAMFKLSDHLSTMPDVISPDAHAVMVHNRHNLDLIMGQTSYTRPARSWNDYGREI